MWIARTAEKVTETVSPKNAEGIHYTYKSAGKVAVTDQRLRKLLRIYHIRGLS